MVLSTWLEPFGRRQGRHCKSRLAKARSRLCLERLESRDVPTLFTVTTLTDGAPGSLRDAITQSNASAGHNDIHFAVSGTSSLTQGQLTITNGDLTIDAQGQTEIIDAGQLSRVFYVSASNSVTTTLIGLTITNGQVTDDNGGDIRVDGGNLTLSGTTVSNSSAYENMQATNGGGIYMAAASGQLVVSAQSVIENNSAVYGGGIYDSNGNLVVDNSTITGNRAGGDGGGIYITGTAGPTAIVRNYTTISNNGVASGNGGGIYIVGVLLPSGLYSGVVTNIDRTTFQNNGAGYDENYSPTGYGGGLADFDVPVPDPSVPSVSVTNSTFNTNGAGVGGGVAVESGDLADGQERIARIDTCLFENNTVIRDGGGVSMDGHWATDGTVLWPADTDTVLASTFTNNTAGTDLPYPYNYGGDGGGFASSYSENSTILSSTFTLNTVQHGDLVHGSGGGILGGDFLDVENSTVSNNSALGGGGIADETIDSIFLQACRINQTVISDNTATNGSCGGLFSGNDNTTVINSTVHHNSAQTDAGGASFYPPDEGSTLTITGSTFDNNTAGLSTQPHDLPWVAGQG
jgi:hypothetical protein